MSCSVGSKSRCQYTLYGATVNLAARMMAYSSKAKASGHTIPNILCDDQTALNARGRFYFKTLEPVLENQNFGVAYSN